MALHCSQITGSLILDLLTLPSNNYEQINEKG